MKKMTAMTLGLSLAVSGAAAQTAETKVTDADNFYKSKTVSMRSVTFPNQYKMKVAGTLFLPPEWKQENRYPAVIVGHPMGAVKEQSANLYAAKIAEKGFVTLSLDLSFWGPSEGERASGSLRKLCGGFQRRADYLGTRSFIDRKPDWRSSESAEAEVLPPARKN